MELQLSGGSSGWDITKLPPGAVLSHPDFPVPLVTQVRRPLPWRPLGPCFRALALKLDVFCSRACFALAGHRRRAWPAQRWRVQD